MYQISQSAYASWLRCEQKYEYEHVRRLRPRVASQAPQLGNLLHEYLATYYRALATGYAAQEAHLDGLANGILKREAVREIKSYVSVLTLAGRTDEAREYGDLLDRAARISERYYVARGREDAERYQAEMVEQSLIVEVVPGVNSIQIIDLVLLDRMNGNRYLVEHKSTATVPPSSVRLRDFQTMLYAAVLDRYGKPVDGVLWNYLRTKEPAIPEPLVKGGLTRKKDLDTTWEVYAAALAKHTIEPALYEDMRARLDGREKSVFFPRYEHQILSVPEIILRDYAMVAGRIRNARMRWEAGIEQPVRSISRDCDYCSFYRICETVIVGGDEDTAIKLNYTTSDQRKAIQNDDSHDDVSFSDRDAPRPVSADLPTG